MIATYSLVLLLALHALKIATNLGSGAIINRFCSRSVYDCAEVGTALVLASSTRAIAPQKDRRHGTQY